MSLFLLRRAAWLCGAVSLLPVTAQAQNAPDQDPGWTPENSIVVTGFRDDYTIDTASVSRVQVPIIEVPQSIQVLTSTLIREQELNTLDEALRNVSGVIPSLSSELVLANPIVRGFEAEIFTDGMIGYADTAVLDPASLIAVERIEIAKGATSTLFGGGTGAPVGGLINIVSRTAQPEMRFAGRIRAGSFDTIQIAGDANIAPSEGFAIRAIAEYQDSGDAIDVVDIERLLINGSVRAVLPSATEIVGRIVYSRVEQLEYVGLPAEIADAPGVDPFRFSGATNAPPTEVENLTFDLSVSQPLGEGLTLDFRARRYENDFREFASTTFLAFFPGQGTEFPHITAQLPAEVNEWTFDVSLNAEFSTGAIAHALLIGAQYDETDYEAATGFNLTPVGILDYADPASDLDFGAIPTLNNFVENQYRTTAVYLHDQITLFDRLHILASIRYSELEITQLVGGNGNDQRYSEWDPRIGVNFEVTEGLALFAGYAEGSRLSIFFNNPTVSPVPERASNYEAGIKFGLADIGLTGTIAAYQSTRKNVPTPDPTTFFTAIQTGEQKSRGVELDLIWEPNANWSVLASYAHTDAEVTSDTVIPEGGGLPRVADHAGHLAARYRVTEGPFDGLAVGGGFYAASGAEITLPNSFRSDDYIVFDLQASYDFGRGRIGLRIDNLFDADYFLPYQYLAQPVVRPGNPRSAFVTLTFEI